MDAVVCYGLSDEDFGECLCVGDKQAEIAGLLADNKAEKLATAHWRYIKSVLKQHGEDEDVIAKCGHHYKAAFVHGWKHAKEEA